MAVGLRLSHHGHEILAYVYGECTIFLDHVLYFPRWILLLVPFHGPGKQGFQGLKIMLKGKRPGSGRADIRAVQSMH